MEGPAADNFNVLPGRPFKSFTEAAVGVLQALEGQLPGSVVFVSHLDEEQNEQRIIDRRGDSSFGFEPGTTRPLDESFCRPMAFEEAPRFANDPAEVEAYRDLPARTGSGIGSYLGVPLALSDGRAVGSLCALSHESGSYTDEDLKLIGSMSRMLSLQLESEARERTFEAATEHLRELSSTDPVTGVLNRRGLGPLLEREWKLADRHSVNSILVTASIDRFRRLSEKSGPAAGDRMLRTAAATLADCSRSTDLVARIAVDEFAVVLVGTKGDHPTPYVQRVTERLASDDRAPTLSFGWSKLSTATSPEHAIDLANGLMYKRRAVSGRA